MRISPAMIEGTKRYLARLELAREADPQAFEPVMTPHYTDDQLWRQQVALRKVETDHPELAPPVAGQPDT